jgi:hypothetical protein
MLPSDSLKEDISINGILLEKMVEKITSNTNNYKKILFN